MRTDVPILSYLAPILFISLCTGCVEILADIACAAGADRVVIGHQIETGWDLSKRERAQCTAEGTCHCLDGGPCFLEEGNVRTLRWRKEIYRAHRNSTELPVSFDCREDTCAMGALPPPWTHPVWPEFQGTTSGM